LHSECTLIRQNAPHRPCCSPSPTKSNPLTCARTPNKQQGAKGVNLMEAASLTAHMYVQVKCKVV
jgi:hypothetical protein